MKADTDIGDYLLIQAGFYMEKSLSAPKIDMSMCSINNKIEFQEEDLIIIMQIFDKK